MLMVFQPEESKTTVTGLGVWSKVIIICGHWDFNTVDVLYNVQWINTSSSQESKAACWWLPEKEGERLW